MADEHREGVGEGPSRLRRWQQEYRARYDAVALLIYLIAVHAIALFAGPLGRDYGLFHSQEELPAGLSHLLAAELRLFSDSAISYHLINLAFLYACMLLVYQLTRSVYPEGRVWLATLAAALFMANPVHAEAVFNLAGVVDLYPALIVLSALWCYGRAKKRGNILAYAGAAGLCVLGIGQFHLFGLAPVFLLYEHLFHLKESPARNAWLRSAPFVALTFSPVLLISTGLVGMNALHPIPSLVPVYFALYPLGFLPETVRTFEDAPWLAWSAAGCVILGVIAVAAKANHRAVWFGLAAALLARIGQGEHTVEPVHLIGGGGLLLATAFLSIALCVVFGKIMEHPKWPRNIVLLTTLLALVLFGMRISTGAAWRHAALKTEVFRREAASVMEPARPVGVLPDYQYFRGAPMMLSESIRYDTPFGDAVHSVSLLRLHYDTPTRLEVDLRRREDEAIELLLTHPDPAVLVPERYRAEALTDMPDVEIVAREDGEWLLVLRPAVVPDVLLPAPAP